MKNTAISTYQFLKLFPNEETARLHIEKIRWNGTVVCPHCGSMHIQTRKRVGYFRCLDCKKDFTVRTGTIFERSHVALDKWLYTIYLVVTDRKGISSLELSKIIGVTQKTAWFMLQRLREACSGKKDSLLSGIVEADETYIGGKESNKHNSKKTNAGRGTIGKAIVFGMKMRDGDVRATVIPNTAKNTIQTEIKNNLEAGSTLMSDEHSSYVGMSEYIHYAVNHSAKEFVNHMAHTNSIESVWALLKRGYYGTFHQFSVKHLQRYVDEFTFRLNEGNCKYESMERIDSLLLRAEGHRITYKQLISC